MSTDAEQFPDCDVIPAPASPSTTLDVDRLDDAGHTVRIVRRWFAPDPVPTRQSPVRLQGTLQPASTTSIRLRVGTFNIHSGRGRDRMTDLSRTARVIDVAPDIIGLNEVRGAFCESWWPNQAAELGKLLSMESAFVPTERRWWHDHFGNAVSLSRFPIQQIHRIPLVGTRGARLFDARRWHNSSFSTRRYNCCPSTWTANLIANISFAPSSHYFWACKLHPS